MLAGGKATSAAGGYRDEWILELLQIIPAFLGKLFLENKGMGGAQCKMKSKISLKKD